MSQTHTRDLESRERRPARARRWPMLAACLLIALTALAPALAQDVTALYLKGDGHPLASLTAEAPTSSYLPNFDPERDAFPGLLIEKGGDLGETDPTKYQMWVTLPIGHEVDGVLGLVFWSAAKDFGVGRRGVVRAFLLDCETGGVNCSLIAETRSDVLDWSGGWATWTKYSLDFGPVSYTVPDTRLLAVKLVVDADSDDDMWIAYDAVSFPSYLTESAPSDIVIDCDFSDWSGGAGNEFVVFDEGGPDDWASPSALDITTFAVSSDEVSSFHLLTGFDDPSPHSVIAATLIDTGINGNADFAVVVRAHETTATVELYRCDDTLAYGCGDYTLERSHPETSYCLSTAPGPWNTDAMIEFVLPFHDLGFDGGRVMLTTLISYAAKSMLNAPKDSVFGEASQKYQVGLFHDTTTGLTVPIGTLGTDLYIRRSTDPAQVRSAAPHDTVTTAPFDDLPGVLGDGQTYYYVVEREGGLPLSLSAHANTHDGTVRLGFDDANGFSAPVDASFSTISLDTAVLPADGTSAATLTLVPRDSNGTMIGSGCEIGLNEVQLYSARLAGPVTDNRNGTYTLRVVSAEAGSVRVRMIVEGVELTDELQIVFE